MKRDLRQKMFNLEGVELKNEKGTPLTLCDVALNALLATFEDERALTGKEKADRYQLALKINKKPAEVDLTAEQMTLLKTLTGKAYGPLIVGQVYELLEQEPKVVDTATG